jgi:23S rRNA-/tRNA-specific pseudouridylate synthase
LLELQPQTGRTHQLRVHCVAIGHPIVGDPVYGDGIGGLGLLARRLELVLADTAIRAEAPWPVAMQAAWGGALPD